MHFRIVLSSGFSIPMLNKLIPSFMRNLMQMGIMENLGSELRNMSNRWLRDIQMREKYRYTMEAASQSYSNMCASLSGKMFH